MSGCLYVVGTPIGNLNDFSPRAIETLKKVDFIAAEDTRVTQKLLARFDIHTKMISYHEHNLQKRGEWLLSRLLNGEQGALVSDAGMPCISDPGEDLIKLCRQNSIPVFVVPGPSAAISALCISGLSASRFVFEGFLTTNHQGRMMRLFELAGLSQTLIFYEAPHKLLTTLCDLHNALGDRNIAIVKELTKLHEQAERTTLAKAVKQYLSGEKTPRGEYVLVVEGAPVCDETEMTLEQAAEFAKKLQIQGLKPAEAARHAAAVGGYKKTQVYKMLLQCKDKEESL